MPLYRFSLQFNGSYAFREYPRITDYQRIHQEIVPDLSGKVFDEQRCEACGELLDKWTEPPQTLVLKNKEYDIGKTYDGITIVSKRFKSVYEAANLQGIIFRRLPSEPAFYTMMSMIVVHFDAARRKTRFINQCSLCGSYESVVGATPIFLKAATEIGYREVVRTDLEFGSNDEKSPLFICGDVAASSLSKSKLRGLDLIAIGEQ